VRGVQVADAGEGAAGRFDAQRAQPDDRGRHQPLAAGLVHRAGARLGHGDLQAGLRGEDRGGESGGTAADDQHVDPGHAATATEARARVSQRSRTVSSAAFRTVNVAAVIHADPASGSAAPSTTTAR
jgi:hypothetical protein